MKYLILLTIVLLPSMTFSAEAEKDWTLDPKTSTLIPKYLGTIKVVSGKAVIGDRELKKGSRVYNNELIQTGEKSFIVLDMIDLTTVTLGPNSDFKVQNWNYKTKNDREATFTIDKGQWRALIKSKSKDMDQLKIKTPVVSMGVRGTELMVNAFKIDGKDVTQVALLHGAIHLENKTGDIKKDMVPGEEIQVIQSEKSAENKTKKLNDEEIKSYDQYMAPGVLKLLDPPPFAKLRDEKNQALNEVGSPVEKAKASGIKEKSLKENLEILNTTREKNRKAR
jgi:hypothetical protein